MDTQQKEQVVAELGAKFSGAGAAFLVSYQGCTCEQLKSLRRKLRPSGADFAIVKNTLARRAISGTDAASLSDLFVGPTAVVWSDEDPVSPAKVLSDFAKANEKFSIRAGVVEGKKVEVTEIESLASLPSKEQLQAQLLALINAPATRLLQTMNAPATELVRLLEAWKAEVEKKS